MATVNDIDNTKILEFNRMSREEKRQYVPAAAMQKAGYVLKEGHADQMAVIENKNGSHSHIRMRHVDSVLEKIPERGSAADYAKQFYEDIVSGKREQERIELTKNREQSKAQENERQ